jgi:hypothetical protein
MSLLIKILDLFFGRRRVDVFGPVVREPEPVPVRILRSGSSGFKYRKHLRHCRTLCRDSVLFADHATLPYELGELRVSGWRRRQHGF